METNRKCTAVEPSNGEIYEARNECNAPAVYLCRDYYGRYVIPRCEFHGEAFSHKRKISYED